MSQVLLAAPPTSHDPDMRRPITVSLAGCCTEGQGAFKGRTGQRQLQTGRLTVLLVLLLIAALLPSGSPIPLSLSACFTETERPTRQTFPTAQPSPAIESRGREPAGGTQPGAQGKETRSTWTHGMGVSSLQPPA